MLIFENITKKYGNFTALEDINLELSEGIYGFLSPNGAGKTTLLKMAATLLVPTGGEIYYDGQNIKQMGEKYREIIGYMPQRFGYYRDYSAVRFLKYFAALKGIERKEAAKQTERLLKRVGLESVKNKKLKTYSGGMLQRVGIALALLGDPKILILDEPTAGLDPKERAEFRKTLKAFSEGKIILYSTHIVSDVESIADRIVMIKDHRLLCNETVKDLMCAGSEGKKRRTLEEIFLKRYEEEEQA